MHNSYFANLNVLFLLTHVSYRCRKCCIFLSFWHFFLLICTILCSGSGKIWHFFFHKGNIRGRNVKCPLKDFAQGFWLCMVLILIQHDQKIRKPAKNIVCTRFNGFSRFHSTTIHFECLKPSQIFKLIREQMCQEHPSIFLPVLQKTLIPHLHQNLSCLKSGVSSSFGVNAVKNLSCQLKA